MVLYELQFGGGPAGTRELYWRGSAAPCMGGGLSFRAGDTAAFDTYFNLFSHEKYARLCGIGGFTLVLHGEGRFLVRFFWAHEGGEEEIAAFAFSDELSAPVDLSALPQQGFVYFSLEAQTEGRIFSGYAAAQPPCPREARIAVVICTYRRERFAEAAVQRFLEAVQIEPAWGERLHLYICDNAGTLRLPPSSLYTLLPGRNLGGSGGFARGMAAAAFSPDAASGFSHILLMDDDVLCPFETLARTWRLVSCLLPEHASATLGGGMLTLERPAVQYEAGGYYDGFHLASRGHGLLLAAREALLANERLPKANFAAWWYCCMDAGSVRAHGLPMPFFIKSDDIEYGIRCGEEIVFMSGIGVWHQDFSAKYSAALEYYIRRNELVTSTLHFPARVTRPKFAMLYNVYKQLTLKRYDAAELILRAYEDFLKGPQFLLTADAQQLQREIAAACAPALSLAKIGKRFPQLSLVQPPPAKRLPLPLRALLLIENFLPACFFKKQPAALPEHDTPVAKAFLRRTAVLCSYGAGTGHICTLDTKRRAKLRRRACKLFFALLFKYKKVKKAYLAQAGELCSAAQWRRAEEGKTDAPPKR